MQHSDHCFPLLDRPHYRSTHPFSSHPHPTIRITPNITELGAYGHLEVLKNKATLAQIREVIREISSSPDDARWPGGAGNTPGVGEPRMPPPNRLPQWPSSDDQLSEDDPNSSDDEFV